MKYVLGIDVGGTKIASGLVDTDFRITKLRTIPTSQTDLTNQIIEIIGSYKGFSGIGLGVPGRVLPNGDVPRLPNIPSFKRTNLQALLARKFKTKVSVINDAKAFTLAEALLGAGKGFETVVGVTLGTGLGSGLVRSGQIYYGKNSVAGELGRIMVKGNLTLEDMLQRRGEFKSPKVAEPLLKMIVAIIIRTIDPDVIVFGGGRTEHPWMQKVLDGIAKSAFNYPIKTVIKVSKLKGAGIVGAALPLLKPVGQGLKK